AGRDTSGMGILLALHLGVVMALFLTLPYGKFAHGFFRCAALLIGDIAENIRYSRPDSSDTEVEIAARQAGLFETVQHLPLGFRTP
ncbi:hypothetical protein ONO12_26635, partial [Salmonella enterica subsp. enterica serovar Montevideo]|nr:hypothetical protein [Salmonella enterica subsp. enterica serovar Montevideo]